MESRRYILSIMTTSRL